MDGQFRRFTVLQCRKLTFAQRGECLSRADTCPNAHPQSDGGQHKRQGSANHNGIVLVSSRPSNIQRAAPDGTICCVIPPVDIHCCPSNSPRSLPCLHSCDLRIAMRLTCLGVTAPAI